MKKPIPSILALVALGLASGPAWAQCTISATPVAFGTYDVFDPVPLSSTGSVTYFCGPPNRPVTIQLGTGSSGTFLARQMANGAERLAYNFYLDAAGTQIWGDGTGGTSVFSGTTGPPGPPSQRTVTITVYGRIPPQQDVTTGVYTDTVVVTLCF